VEYSLFNENINVYRDQLENLVKAALRGFQAWKANLELQDPLDPLDPLAKLLLGCKNWQKVNLI